MCDSSRKAQSGRNWWAIVIVRGEALRGGEGLIRLQLSLKRQLKHELMDALRAELNSAGASWSVVVGAVLVYRTPSTGTWWWSLALDSGRVTRLMLVPPEDHNAEAVIALVRRAIRGGLDSIVCARCDRVEAADGSWHRQGTVAVPIPAFGLCPECRSGGIDRREPPRRHELQAEQHVPARAGRTRAVKAASIATPAFEKRGRTWRRLAPHAPGRSDAKRARSKGRSRRSSA
jgi:hypothetical protein